MDKSSRLPIPPLPAKPAPGLLVNKNVRDRWIQIAKETQEIVLGDGQYVEERCVTPVPCALAQRIEGFSGNPLGQVDSSATVKVAHDISLQIQLSSQGTVFYPHLSDTLADWASPSQHIPSTSSTRKTVIQYTPQSALTAARRLAQHTPTISRRVGVLSPASRKKPGGGYLHGGDNQDERIARLSSLVASLGSPAATEFYNEHKHSWTQDGSGFLDQSMVYSPGVVAFRAEHDDPECYPKDPVGGSFIAPYLIDVLSCVPVNAAVVRTRYASADERTSDIAIRNSMKERMARALRVFEGQGDRHIVLGAFGHGSNENKLDIIADIWAELLVCGDMEGEGGSKRPARFQDSFDTVVFAIPGGKSWKSFRNAFEMRLFEAQVVDNMTSD